MAFDPTGIRVDKEYVYIPEELFKYLPAEYRESVEARREQGSDVLQIVDNDIKGLVRLAGTMQTIASLRFILHRLRNLNFDATTEAVLEQDALTTAFVVTYARLFVSGNGTSRVERKQLPPHLRSIHDDIIDIRHKRYAHSDNHESVGVGVQLHLDDDGFHINMQMSMGMYIGGRNEWEELLVFLDSLIYDRLQKILKRLKVKTGYDWTFPTGPAPD